MVARPSGRRKAGSNARGGPRGSPKFAAYDPAVLLAIDVGGAIAPGLVLGLEALAARTAKLPRVELRAPDRAIGRDTVSAIQSGAIFGYEALVTGLLARLRRELADIGDIPPSGIHTILT